MHMDGALYGSVLPIMKTFGDKNIMDYCNSISISLHKFFGMPMAAGVVLTSEEQDDKVFGEDCDMVEYVTMQDRLTVSGTRSGQFAAMAHRILETLKMD